MKLTGKVALVTGAGNGIGQAVAIVLARHGAHVALADIVESTQTAALIAEEKGKASIFQIDVTKSESIDACITSVAEQCGGIDILMNNAGIFNNGPVLEYNEKQWDLLMSINLKGAFFVAQRVAQEMVKSGKPGCIVNTSSQAGKTPESLNVGYCVSKSGLISITQVMAMELAQNGIRVNAVCPGYTDTVLFQKVLHDRSDVEKKTIAQVEEELFREVPLKRACKPEEIGELVAFLCSDAAAYITGESILINGGKYME